MNFRRTLKDGLVESLNRLYHDPDSWWRKIVDDEDAFVLIRDNRLHFDNVKQLGDGEEFCL
jgi:hypothetical protein